MWRGGRRAQGGGSGKGLNRRTRRNGVAESEENGPPPVISLEPAAFPSRQITTSPPSLFRYQIKLHTGRPCLRVSSALHRKIHSSDGSPDGTSCRGLQRDRDVQQPLSRSLPTSYSAEATGGVANQPLSTRAYLLFFAPRWANPSLRPFPPFPFLSFRFLSFLLPGSLNLASSKKEFPFEAQTRHRRLRNFVATRRIPMVSVTRLGIRRLGDATERSRYVSSVAD